MKKIFIKIIEKIITYILANSSSNFKSVVYGSLRSAYWLKQYEKYRSKYQIHSSFLFNGEGIKFYGNGALICKEGSYIGSNSTISVGSKKVEIGRSCSISHNVRMYTISKFANQNFKSEHLKYIEKDIVIGDFVWIGANVFITPGVKIGSNSVIGANSIVTKDIPDNAIFGGVPAKLLKYKTI